MCVPGNWHAVHSFDLIVSILRYELHTKGKRRSDKINDADPNVDTGSNINNNKNNNNRVTKRFCASNKQMYFDNNTEAKQNVQRTVK